LSFLLKLIKKTLDPQIAVKKELEFSEKVGVLCLQLDSWSILLVIYMDY